MFFEYWYFHATLRSIDFNKKVIGFSAQVLSPLGEILGWS